jgi:type I restriction enzyme M protein
LVLEIIKKYKQSVAEGKEIEFDINEKKIAHIVKKEKIAESGDYNLSGDRYKKAVVYSGKWDFVEVQEAIKTVKYTTKIKKEKFKNKGKYPIVDQSENFVSGYWNNEEDLYKIDNSIVIFGDHTRCFKYIDFDFILGADGVKILDPIKEFNPKFFYFILTSLKIRNLGYSRHFKVLKKIKIPLPPLETQEQIVSELDNYQKIIDGAKQVVENYKPTFKIDPKWEMVELGKMCDLMTGGTPKSLVKEYYGGEIKWIVSGDIHLGEIHDCQNRITQKGLENSNAKYLPINSVLIALNGQGKTRGTVALLRTHATCNQSIVSIFPKNQDTLISEYLYVILKNMYSQIRNITGDNQRSGLNMSIIKKIKIPVPLKETQQDITNKIEKEQKAVNANKELTTIFENKIKDKIADVWGE